MNAPGTLPNPFLFEPDNRTPVTVMLDPATATTRPEGSSDAEHF